MKTTVNPAYTAKEIVEILKEAKALGVISLKLPGFEAAWELEAPKVPPKPAIPPPVKPEVVPEKEDRYCDKCGDEKTQGQNGFYCRTCWLQRKEQGFQRNRRW